MPPDVLFVSAQPDIPFMHWQLEVMGSNFQRMGVPPKQIVMLFARTVEMAMEDLDGVSREFLKESAPPLSQRGECLRQVYRVHDYVDDRLSKDRWYIPSMRLALWREFARDHEDELKQKFIFYHDADVIFPYRVPDFARLIKEAKRHNSQSYNTDMPLGAYLSDTSGYCGHHVFVEKNGRIFANHLADGRGELHYLEHLCERMPQFPKAECVRNVTTDPSSRVGGAQYFFVPGVSTAEFWSRAYDMTMTFYHEVTTFNNAVFPKGFPPNADEQVAWKADMHGVSWALWSMGWDTRNTIELAFTWAVFNDMDGSAKNKGEDVPAILHMAGAFPQDCQGGGKGDGADRSMGDNDKGGARDRYGGAMCHFNKGQYIDAHLTPLKTMCHTGIDYWNFVSKNSNSRTYLREIEVAVGLHSTPQRAWAPTSVGGCFTCEHGAYALTRGGAPHWSETRAASEGEL